MCFSSHRVLRTIITYRVHDGTWRPWSTILNLRATFITEILGIKLTINIRWASLVSIICIWLARFLISVISLVVLIWGWSLRSILLLGTVVPIISTLVHLTKLARRAISSASSLGLFLAVLNVWRVKLVHKVKWKFNSWILLLNRKTECNLNDSYDSINFLPKIRTIQKLKTNYFNWWRNQLLMILPNYKILWMK